MESRIVSVNELKSHTLKYLTAFRFRSGIVWKTLLKKVLASTCSDWQKLDWTIVTTVVLNIYAVMLSNQ